jgi:hypothetical protein
MLLAVLLCEVRIAAEVLPEVLAQVQLVALSVLA